MSKIITLHYFISKIEHSAFHEIKGRLYNEYESINYYGDRVRSFKCLEDFNCHISKDQEHYESVRFKIDFGKDSCTGHWADNLKDFKADFAKKVFADWEPCTRKEYESLRKELFEIYQQKMFLDIDTIKTIQDYTVKILTR
ncbi:hypothetical protein JCM19294_1153 [Nonlabens tegetincola]|uniref:Uncharacterized protein n=1 Tax=Nonlabens tegetincola TaxID=323273 RepID=A0A090Q178_9FLAO|nr:hypothetical protein [Nonlabens tegetincola]GAK96844.1 hypothetical protein JCM19294_1153 [Nonlabens tegetincola]